VNSGHYCHTPGHLGSKCRQRNSGRKSKSIPRAHLSRALSRCKHPTHPVTYTRYSISTSGDFPPFSPPGRPSIPSIDDNGLRVACPLAWLLHNIVLQVKSATVQSPNWKIWGIAPSKLGQIPKRGPWRNPTCIPHHRRAPDRRPKSVCVGVYINRSHNESLVPS
jgi:hypothetical protein